MNLSSWMKDIADDTPVLMLNLVGTHDCVTQFVQLSHISRCQDMNIFDQLSIGVRGLDIRVKSNDDRLTMVHGPANAFNTSNRLGKPMDMDDVLSHCYSFLEENSSECIVFQFKNDSGKEMEKCFDNLFNTYIKGNEDKWFLENRCPLLKEARGKIILIRRCNMADRDEYNEKNTGIDFSGWVEQDTAEPYPLTLTTGGECSMEFLIQDRFKYKPEPRWEKVIEPFLNSMTEFNGTFVINYLSTAGGIKGPYNNSKYINPKFMEYELKNGIYYGMIYTDFPTIELTKKVIKTNEVLYENK